MDAFKADQDVKTTPQVLIGGERIGGYDDLRRYLGIHVAKPGATSYRPVLALFAMTTLMALAVSQAALGSPLTLRAAEWFIGFSLCVLALLKLQDVEKFATPVSARQARAAQVSEARSEGGGSAALATGTAALRPRKENQCKTPSP